ncbi:MAG: hypothetical protein HIU92_18490 [Proteobacteria bacterium]|nr:hypothetical protein [Pseudomonadota bacterium]
MSGSDSDKIKTLEKALEMSAKELLKLNATIALQRARLRACEQDSVGLKKTITILNAQLEMDQSKMNGHAQHSGSPKAGDGSDW